MQQQLKEVKDLHIGAANQLNKVQADKDALEKEKQRLVTSSFRMPTPNSRWLPTL